MSKLLTGLKIAVIKPKKVSKPIIRQGTIQEATVLIDDEGVYKASISMKNDPNHPDVMILDFTEKSFELKDRITVFERKRDERGRLVKHIRSREKAKHHPGLKEQYIPFASGLTIRGYLVRDEGVLKFDFKDLGIKEEINNDYPT